MGEYFWFVQEIDTEIQIPSIFLWQLFWAASLWLEVTLGNKITFCLQLSWAANSQSFVVVFPIWLEMDEACGSVRPVALCCKRIGEWGHWVRVCVILRVKTRYIGCPRKKYPLEFVEWGQARSCSCEESIRGLTMSEVAVQFKNILWDTFPGTPCMYLYCFVNNAKVCRCIICGWGHCTTYSMDWIEETKHWGAFCDHSSFQQLQLVPPQCCKHTIIFNTTKYIWSGIWIAIYDVFWF